MFNKYLNFSFTKIILFFIILLMPLSVNADYNDFNNNKTLKIENYSTIDRYQIMKNFSYSDFSGLQSDWDDIRFVYPDGSNINYWIEEKSDGQWAKIWLDLYGNEDYIKIIWNNSNVTSASNITNTFEFADDFDGTTLNTTKWNYNDGLKTTVNNGILTVNANNVDKKILSNVDVGTNYILRTKIKQSAYTINYYHAFGFGNQADTDKINIDTSYNAGSLYGYASFKKDSSSSPSTNLGISSSSESTTYGIWEVIRNGNSNVTTTLNGNNKLVYNNPTYIPQNELNVLITHYTSALYTYYDWILVRPYLTIEPTLEFTESYNISEIYSTSRNPDNDTSYDQEITYNVCSTNSTEILWYVNDTLVETDNGLNGSFTYSSNLFGDFNITAVSRNSFTTDSYTWNLSVVDITFTHDSIIYILNPSSTDGVQVLRNFSYSDFTGLQSDWDDIRFRTIDNEPLNYWIENKTDGVSANIWIKLPANDTQIKVLWGNEYISSASNGTKTFEFFDNFSGTSLNTSMWSTGYFVTENSKQFATYNTGYNTPSLYNGYLRFDGTRSSINAAYEDGVNSGWWGRSVNSVDSIDLDSFKIESRMYFTQTSTGTLANQYNPFIIGVGKDKDNMIVGYVSYTSGTNIWREVSGTNTNVNGDSGVSSLTNTWKRVSVDFVNNGLFKYSIDGKSCSYNVGQTLSDKKISVAFNHRAPSASVTQYVDWIAVRKYVETEPEVIFEDEIEPSNITSATNDPSVNNLLIDEEMTFNIESVNTDNVKWYVNGALIETDTGTSGSFIFTTKDVGDYNITAITECKFGDDINTWNISVNDYILTDQLNIIVVNPSTTDNVQILKNFSYSAFEGLQSDWDDIRFTDSNGNYLDHFIENKTDGEWANIWIKLPANEEQILALWGNESAISLSNGTNTFVFYDGFDEGSINYNIWDSTQSSCTYINEDGITEMRLLGNTNNVAKSIKSYDNVNKITEVRLKYETFGSYGPRLVLMGNGVSPTSCIEQYATTAGNWRKTAITKPNGNVLSNAVASYYTNTWYNAKLTVTNYTHYWSIADVNVNGNYALTSPINGVFCIWTWDTGNDIRLDWVRVREYVEIEPTIVLYNELYGSEILYNSPNEVNNVIILNNSTTYEVSMNNVNKIDWYLDNTLIQTNNSIANVTFTHYFDEIGTYNVTSIGTNTTNFETTSITWNSFVQYYDEKPYWINENKLYFKGNLSSGISKFKVEKNAGNAPNGHNTFIIFDDFSTDSSANYTSLNGAVKEYDSTNKYLKQTATSSTSKFIVHNTYITENAYKYEAKINLITDTANRNHAGMATDYLKTALTGYRLTHLDNEVEIIKYTNGVESGLSAQSGGTEIWNDNRWINETTYRDRTTGELKYVMEYQGTNRYANCIDTTHTTGSVGLHSYGSVVGWDDIRVSKYNNPEPIATIEDKETYYEITVNSINELTDYQVMVDITDLNITEDESLHICLDDVIENINIFNTSPLNDSITNLKISDFITFSANITNIKNITWYVDNVNVYNESYEDYTTKNINYTHTFNTIGIHNITLFASNDNNNEIYSWYPVVRENGELPYWIDGHNNLRIKTLTLEKGETLILNISKDYENGYYTNGSDVFDYFVDYDTSDIVPIWTVSNAYGHTKGIVNTSYVSPNNSYNIYTCYTASAGSFSWGTREVYTNLPFTVGNKTLEIECKNQLYNIPTIGGTDYSLSEDSINGYTKYKYDKEIASNQSLQLYSQHEGWVDGSNTYTWLMNLDDILIYNRQFEEPVISVINNTDSYTVYITNPSVEYDMETPVIEINGSMLDIESNDEFFTYSYETIKINPYDSNQIIYKGENEKFTINSSTNVNIDWLLDSEIVQNDNTQNSEYIFNGEISGIYNLTTTIYNTEELISKTWEISVVPKTEIINSNPFSNVNIQLNDTKTFTIHANNVENITWYLDGINVNNNTFDLKDDTFTFTNNFTEIGEFNVTVIVSNTNVNNITISDSYTWNVNVKKLSKIPYFIDEDLNVWFNVNVPLRSMQNLNLTFNNEYMQDPKTVFTIYDGFDENSINDYSTKYYLAGNYGSFNYKDINDGYLHLGFNESGTGSALLYMNETISDNGNYLFVSRFNASGICDYNNQKELGLSTSNIDPILKTNCNINADYIGWLLNDFIAMSDNNGQSSSLITSSQEYDIVENGYRPAIWIQDVSELNKSDMYIDYFYVRKISDTILNPVVTNENNHFNISLSNLGATNINNYQFCIDGESLGITSQNTGLNILYEEPVTLIFSGDIVSKYPDSNDVTTTTHTNQEFNIEFSQYGNFTWYIDNEIVKQENNSFTSEYIGMQNISDSYNITVAVTNVNGTVSNSWDWNVIDAGNLIIKTHPENCNIYINDNYYITGDLNTWLSAGLYNITITHDDYYNLTFSSQIIVNQETKEEKSLSAIEGNLNITSTPSGARIYLNNIPYSTTPRVIPLLSEGNYNLKLVASGYANYTENIFITKNSTLTKDIIMSLPSEPEDQNSTLGNIVINVYPETAKIYLNDTYYGTGDINRWIEEGNYLINITNDEYYTYSEIITLVKNEKFEKSYSLTPFNGYLDVSTTPSGASVYINNVYKGVTPLTINELYPKTYNLLLSYPYYINNSQSITIPINNTLTVSETLYRPAYLNIDSTPEGAYVKIDNVVIGLTPLTNYIVPEGSHNITIGKKDYYSYYEEFTLDAYDTKNIDVTLNRPALGSINIATTPSDATYIISGGDWIGGYTYTGKTPKTFDAFSGQYNVILYKQYYHTITSTINVIGNETTYIDETFIPVNNTCRISVDSPDNCEVFIDNRSVGFSRSLNNHGHPRYMYVSLFPETHTIRIEKEGYVPYEGTINVPLCSSNYPTYHYTIYPILYNATLNVYASPVASTVYFDGQNMGSGSPIIINNIPATSTWQEPYTHNLTIVHDGYTSRIFNILTPSASNMNFYATIYPEGETPTKGTLLVCTDPNNANLEIDNNFVGNTPLYKELDIGTYSIEIYHDDYETINKEITINAGEMTFVNENLNLSNGILVIDSIPSSSAIFINDELYGITPKSIILEPNTYLLKLSKSGYNDLIKTFTILPTETLTLNENLIEGENSNNEIPNIIINENLSKMSLTPYQSTQLSIETNNTATSIIAELLTPEGYEYYLMNNTENNIWSVEILPYIEGNFIIRQYYVVMNNQIHTESSELGFLSLDGAGNFVYKNEYILPKKVERGSSFLFSTEIVDLNGLREARNVITTINGINCTMILDRNSGAWSCKFDQTNELAFYKVTDIYITDDLELEYHLYVPYLSAVTFAPTRYTPDDSSGGSSSSVYDEIEIDDDYEIISDFDAYAKANQEIEETPEDYYNYFYEDYKQFFTDITENPKTTIDKLLEDIMIIINKLLENFKEFMDSLIETLKKFINGMIDHIKRFIDNPINVLKTDLANKNYNLLIYFLIFIEISYIIINYIRK